MRAPYRNISEQDPKSKPLLLLNHNTKTQRSTTINNHPTFLSNRQRGIGTKQHMSTTTAAAVVVTMSHFTTTGSPPPVSDTAALEFDLEKLQAGAFRSLIQHLQTYSEEVSNIDLMTLAGFCRNCLAKVRFVVDALV